jgi:hypothetical protein
VGTHIIYWSVVLLRERDVVTRMLLRPHGSSNTYEQYRSKVRENRVGAMRFGNRRSRRGEEVSGKQLCGATPQCQVS